MELKRFGVSIPKDLLEQFDEVVARKGYVGRSEAIRDAMRLYISKHHMTMKGVSGFASLNIVYTHSPRLSAALLESQHDSKANVISTVHTHITQTHCFETLTIKGSIEGIQRLADRIGGLKGIEYIELFTFTLPGLDHNETHGHMH
ncbi:MAG: nickel-responsive transcriptional regulator NikR [Candidatus Thorarchaeota archaeon]